MTSIQNRISLIIRSEWPGVVVVLIAIALRIYRLSAQPLWLDEIFSVQISHQTLFAILQNSFREPNPPLYHILQMLSSGIWNVHSEVGWRWLSVLWGILTIPGFYLLCRRFASRTASALAGLTLAVLPFHIYYSQEARSMVFAALLTVWSTILVADLLSIPRSPWRWVALAICSLVGLYSYYFYLLIIGVQGLILFIHTRRREWWLYAAIISIGSVPALMMIMATIPANAQLRMNLTPLTLLAAIQSLAGEPVRFGVNWQQWWLMGVVGITALLGAYISSWRAKKGLLGSYFTLQLLLPLIIFVSLDIALDIRLPLYESRMFLILVPALLGLFAFGLDFILKHLGGLIPALLCAAILVTSGASLSAYWNLTKSGESSLVLNIRPEIKPTDTIVSLDYYTTAAAYFYLQGVPVLNYLRENNGTYQFTNDLLLYPISLPGSAQISMDTSYDIRASSRFWILNRDGIHLDVQTSLTDQCVLVKTTKVSRFTATLWENCQP